jgi:hypothetical protein
MKQGRNRKYVEFQRALNGLKDEIVCAVLACKISISWIPHFYMVMKFKIWSPFISTTSIAPMQI